MSKNGKPKVTRKQIQGLINGFEKQLPQLEKEFEAADTALSDWKRAEIEHQKAETVSAHPGDILPRAQIFHLENTEERKHLEYERKRAVGQLGDIQRRIKLLEKALRLTPK